MDYKGQKNHQWQGSGLIKAKDKSTRILLILLWKYALNTRN